MSFIPTPEQLALREARRLKKEKAAAPNADVVSPGSLVSNEKGRIIERPWLSVQHGPPNSSRTARIMTWNVRNFHFHPCAQR